MKKILTVFVALAMTIAASAQTFENAGPFGMPYVSVNGGAVSALNADSFKEFVKGVRPTAGLEIGTYVTPIWGFSVEGTALFNTTNAHTIVDQHSVLANAKVNLSNLFGGYKGYPRRVEVVAVPGIGWGHDYGELEEIKDYNYFNYRAAAEVNVNLGKERAWQVNVRPGILWMNRGEKVVDRNVIRPKFENAFANITLGVTYKFGNKKTGSHNFAYCPYSVTKADYDAAVAKIQELEARQPETIVKEVEKIVEKEVVKVEVKYSVLPLTVKFKMGSAKLEAAEKDKLAEYVDMIPEDSQVVIVGSADSKTGSAARNNFLANERANVVANAFREMGVKNIVVKTAIDVDDIPAKSRVAIVEVSE